ncbi:MAG: hypothetical protein LLF81_00625 [Porphyromonadaceae bacterium]|nr:hypothetical protein [Porphyromonadaceae bacterium]
MNLLLYPDTFLWFTLREGILYNCHSKKLMQFGCNNLIYKYCKKLDDPQNLYSVEINREDYDTGELRNWLDNIQKLKIGSIYFTEKVKRISLPPILNLRNEIEHAESDGSSYTDTINPSENIHEITLFVGGSSKKNDYYKQVLYPIHSDKYIDFNSVIYFFDNYNLNHIHNLNVVFSDISKYSELNKLVSLLESFDFSINYYIDDYQYNSVRKLLNIINRDNSYLNCYFSGIDNLKQIASINKNKFYDIKWLFLLDNEDKINNFDEICIEWKLENVEYWLIYTVSNDLFFRNNVYTTLRDIKEIKHTRQMIFCNQVLNSNFWGNLFILPDGMIYYNLNSAPIGRIEDDIMKRISIDIIQGSTPWKLTRNNITPCKECNFRLLCPPPSNYEYSQEKYDMCFKNG